MNNICGYAVRWLGGFVLCLIMLLALTSCQQELKPVLYELVDNNRTYPPIQQGTEKHMLFEIRDTCDFPLFIVEIQTSAGLTIDEEVPLIVLPHKSHNLKVAYDSSLHTGQVDHFINLYGNLTYGSICRVECYQSVCDIVS